MTKNCNRESLKDSREFGFSAEIMHNFLYDKNDQLQTVTNSDNIEGQEIVLKTDLYIALSMNLRLTMNS